MSENIVLFCNCKARKETPIWGETAALLARDKNINLFMINDLCGWCVQAPEKLAELFGKSGRVLIIACHPRAVSLLLNQAGINQPDKVSFFNLLDDSQNNLMALLEKHRNSFPDKSGSTFTFERFPENSTFAGSANPSWPSWYPVIDYARCNNCGQCAEFCLFGVYEKSDGKVAVVNPKSCKNNCPACARICPQVAIVFPKYAQGGVIGGSESFDEVAEMQRLQQDTDTILGNDIYQALESRKMKRRLIIRGDAMERAIRERDEALGHNPPSGPV